MDQKDFSQLQNLLSGEISGIIWESECPLKDDPKHYHAFDYFFDGLLSKSLQVNQEKSSSVFITEQFGEKFILSFIAPETTDHEIQEQLSIFKQLVNQNKKIAFLKNETNSSKKIKIFLSKNFQDQFVEY